MLTPLHFGIWSVKGLKLYVRSSVYIPGVPRHALSLSSFIGTIFRILLLATGPHACDLVSQQNCFAKIKQHYYQELATIKPIQEGSKRSLRPPPPQYTHLFKRSPTIFPIPRTLLQRRSVRNSKETITT